MGGVLGLAPCHEGNIVGRYVKVAYPLDITVTSGRLRWHRNQSHTCAPCRLEARKKPEGTKVDVLHLLRCSTHTHTLTLTLLHTPSLSHTPSFTHNFHIQLSNCSILRTLLCLCFLSLPTGPSVLTYCKKLACGVVRSCNLLSLEIGPGSMQRGPWINLSEICVAHSSVVSHGELGSC